MSFAPARPLWRAFRRVRPEEALFVVGFVPSSIVTIWANLSVAPSGPPAPRFESALIRLVAAMMVAGLMPLLEWAQPRLAARMGAVDHAGGGEGGERGPRLDFEHLNAAARDLGRGRGGRFSG